jgi:hypothetical protein
MSKHPDQELNNNSTPTKRPACGIIMPIAGFGAYTEGHWNDVLRIVKRAAEAAGFDSAMVSTGADVGVIHANIINNIYSNEMVVCDVSGKNANVMFELGLRLASKLPVIIIKDELTGYSFDTSPIQHINYRSDLRLFETLEFQEELAKHISSTYERSKQPDYRTFLDHFGNYTLAKVEDKAVDLSSFMNAIFSRLDTIEQRQLINQPAPKSTVSRSASTTDYKAINDLALVFQDSVDAVLSKRQVVNDTTYNQAFTDIEEVLRKNHSGVITLFGPTITGQAIELAIKSNLANSPRSDKKSHSA